jgi:hypothetical protein
MAFPAEQNANDTSTFKSLCTQIKGDADIQPWTDRAYWFLEQELWELAAADYHHVLQILDAQRTSEADDDEREKCEFGLGLALHKLGANIEALEVINGIAPRKDANEERHLRKLRRSVAKGGNVARFVRHRYPWMGYGELTRSNEHMNEIKSHYRKRGLDIDRSSFLVDPEVYGVYPMKGLNRTGKSFFSEGIIAAPVEEQDDTVDALLHIYLDVLLKSDLDHLRRPWNPLLDSVVRLLRTDYSDKVQPAVFSYERHIKSIYATLKKRGIKFCELRFDWWHLFTVLWRLEANALTFTPDFDGATEKEQRYIGIASAFTFLNHSCAPNVSRSTSIVNTTTNFAERSTSTTVPRLSLTANRNIRPDEELFISFLTPAQLELPVRKRRDLLREWIPDGCMCARCASEDSEPGRQIGEKRKRDVQVRKSPRKGLGLGQLNAGMETAAKRLAVGVNVPDDDWEEMELD